MQLACENEWRIESAEGRTSKVSGGKCSDSTGGVGDGEATCREY
jgi:hypothetical protein